MADLLKSATAPPQPDANDAMRKDAMRKSGAEYFDRVLAKAQAGKDPFREPPKARRRSTDAEASDPDLETVGRVLEGSRLYVISALFIVSSSCSLILAKGALRGLKTPCIQAFLHVLPAIGLLWGLVEVAPLTVGLAKGVALSAAVTALQTVALFGALLYADVKLVVAWVVLCPALLQTALALYEGRSVRKLQMALMVIGVFGLLLGSLLGIWPGLLGTLSLLTWTAGQAGSQAWEAWKGDREMAIRFLGEKGAAIAAGMAQEEARIKPGSLNFYRAALPAGPILVLGFICLEGVEVVNHELSVPAVSLLLMSVVCWATAYATGALLADLPSVASRANLEPFWGFGALTAIVSVMLLPQVLMLFVSQCMGDQQTFSMAPALLRNVEGMTAGWRLLAAALAIGSGVGTQLMQLYRHTDVHVPILPGV